MIGTFTATHTTDTVTTGKLFHHKKDQDPYHIIINNNHEYYDSYPDFISNSNNIINKLE